VWADDRATGTYIAKQLLVSTTNDIFARNELAPYTTVSDTHGPHEAQFYASEPGQDLKDMIAESSEKADFAWPNWLRVRHTMTLKLQGTLVGKSFECLGLSGRIWGRCVPCV
jgi:hypothetical protein